MIDAVTRKSCAAVSWQLPSLNRRGRQYSIAGTQTTAINCQEVTRVAEARDSLNILLASAASSVAVSYALRIIRHSQASLVA